MRTFKSENWSITVRVIIKFPLDTFPRGVDDDEDEELRSIPCVVCVRGFDESATCCLVSTSSRSAGVRVGITSKLLDRVHLVPCVLACSLGQSSFCPLLVCWIVRPSRRRWSVSAEAARWIDILITIDGGGTGASFAHLHR